MCLCFVCCCFSTAVSTKQRCPNRLAVRVPATPSREGRAILLLSGRSSVRSVRPTAPECKPLNSKGSAKIRPPSVRRYSGRAGFCRLPRRGILQAARPGRTVAALYAVNWQNSRVVGNAGPSSAQRRQPARPAAPRRGSADNASQAAAGIRHPASELASCSASQPACLRQAKRGRSLDWRYPQGLPARPRRR